ncbi:MAG: ABC transporter substrate-binding protein [Caldilineaceae bacterium]
MRKNLVFSLLAILTLLITACAPANTVAPGSAAGGQASGDQQAAASSGDLTRPHPMLSDINVRKAIAQCIDRNALIAAAYPYVPQADQANLRMDSWIPKGHWAYGGPYTDYPFDPEAAKALLEQAGWTQAEGADFRTNANGDTLELTLTTTASNLRQTIAAIMEQELAECGILLIRQHVPASWWFGDTTGIAVRDFELGLFAWTGQADPSGRSLYACDQIPLPTNNWLGQNDMGWCNKEASDAVVAAVNTLNRDERAKYYDIVQEKFAEDMVSLPLFQRAEAEAWNLKLQGLRPDPTENGSASVADWSMEGKDTIVVGFSQEPASMWGLVENANVANVANQIGRGIYNTQYSYDYQAVLQKQMSTIESGLATNNKVKVKAGDTVYSKAGAPVKLEKGTELLIDGETVVYDGSSELEMPQLVVTYQWNPYTWSDGTPGSIDDFKLAFRINCDRTSGATEFNTCDEFGTETDALSNISFSDSELAYTITYWPGVQDPTYFAAPFTISPAVATYPSHQVLSDGRKLVDVPANEWTTLPEIAQNPLSFGPYVLTNWVKGQSMTFDRNPYYQGKVGAEHIAIVIVEDTLQLVAQLLSGDVDYLDKTTLAGGPEAKSVSDAAAEGKVNFKIIASPTWEHMDMNLFVKEK